MHEPEEKLGILLELKRLDVVADIMKEMV